jgi:hypothetical protein
MHHARKPPILDTQSGDKFSAGSIGRRIAADRQKECVVMFREGGPAKDAMAVAIFPLLCRSIVNETDQIDSRSKAVQRFDGGTVVREARAWLGPVSGHAFDRVIARWPSRSVREFAHGLRNLFAVC